MPTQSRGTPPKQAESLAKWKSLFNFTTRRHIPIFFISALVSVLAGAVIPVQSYLVGKIFTSFTRFASGGMSETQFNHDVQVWVLYLLALGTASWVCTSICFACWTLFGDLQARSAREKVLSALIGREMSWFDQRGDGMVALTTKVQSFIRDLQTATAQPIGFAIRDLTTACSSLALAFSQSWKLTLVTMATFPIILVLTPLISSRIVPNITQQQDILAQAAKHVGASLSAIETIKACKAEELEHWRYSNFLRNAGTFYNRQVNWSACQAAIMRAVTLAIFVQGFWYGSTIMGTAGDGMQGNVLTAFWSCVMATGAMMQVMPYLMVLEKGKVAGHCLRLVMAASPSAGKKTATRKPRKCVGDVLFEDVSFAYEKSSGHLALNGVNLFFAAGDLTFVVGRSGSGKSTIGQLLAAVYRPSHGRVTLDNVDIATIDPTWLQSNVLLVEQASVLFNTTIEENIAIATVGKKDVDPEDIRKASDFARIRSTIEAMPHAYQTMVTGNGTSLSGGQKQRVALARARIRDPQVLILDESTSALDCVNRGKIMRAIRKWRRGRTTIVITHDLDMIQGKDFVYVLDEGRVMQQGFRSAIEEGNSEVLCASEGGSEEDGHLIERVKGKGVVQLDDPLDWYLDQPTTPSTRMWAPSMFSPATGPNVGGYSPSLVTPFWPVVPENQMANLKLPSLPSLSLPSLRGSRRVSKVSRSMMASPFFEPTGFRPSRLFSTPAFLSPNLDLLSPMSATFGPDMLKPTTLETTPRYSLISILSTVWPCLTRWQRLDLGLGFVAALLYAASTPLFAFVFAKLLNTLYDPIDRRAKARKFSLAILGMAVGDAVALFIALSRVQCLAQIWVNQIRKKALKNILRQPREFFDADANETSRVVECLDRTAEEMQHILGRFVGNLLIVVVMVLVAVIWSMAICWKLTLVLLACTPILMMVSSGLSTVGAVMAKESHDAAESTNSVFAETFATIKTVRTLTLEEHFQKKHSAAAAVALKVAIRKGVYVGLFEGLSQSVVLYIMALIFYYASVLLRQHNFELEPILEVLTLLLLSIPTATTIMSTLPQLSTAREAAARVLRLADLPAETTEHDGTIRTSSIGIIKIRNLCFAYPSCPRIPVLKNLNLTIKAGSCTAIVGPSGSGKSTLASLLLKLYPPSSGNILVTSRRHSLSSVSTRSLRNLIAIVPQTPHLFPVTVSANIVYGLRSSDPRNSAANVLSAAIQAGIHDFISGLPAGYDTVLGDGGVGVSGGQAQRIAIARGIARRPEVLILDEATASLDRESARVVRESVEGLRTGEGGMTVLVVTHKRDMMMLADWVVVMDQGRIVEDGEFDELIERGGRFTEMMDGREE